MKSYIPTINISSLLKSDFNTLASKNTLRKIEKACIDIGFFQVIGHGIEIKKINNICKIGNRFFNSPNTTVHAPHPPSEHPFLLPIFFNFILI